MQELSQRLLNCMGALIGIHRLASGMSQEELAAKIGVSRETIASIETGRQSYYLDQIILIAKALKTDVACLLPEDGVLLDPKQPVFRTLLEYVRPTAYASFLRLVVPTSASTESYLSSREHDEQTPKRKKPRAPRKARRGSK